MQDPGNGSVACPCGCGGWMEPGHAAKVAAQLAERPGAHHTQEQAAQMGAPVARGQQEQPKAAPPSEPRVQESRPVWPSPVPSATPQAAEAANPVPEPPATPRVAGRAAEAAPRVFDLSTTEGIAAHYQHYHKPAPAPAYP